MGLWAWSDLVEPLIEQGGECEPLQPPDRGNIPVKKDGPDFARFSRFMRLWEALPLERQAAITLKTVTGRFGSGEEAERIAAYLLVTHNYDAPGQWFEDKLIWARRALRGVGTPHFRDGTFAAPSDGAE